MLRKLALLTPGQGKPLTESLSQVTSGSSALVVVSAGDLPGIRAIRLAVPTLYQPTVIALEDFGEPVGGVELLDSLEVAGVAVARCRPGQLPETLQALERLPGLSYEKRIAA